MQVLYPCSVRVTIRNGSHSILLYFKLLPLVVLGLSTAAAAAENCSHRWQLFTLCHTGAQVLWLLLPDLRFPHELYQALIDFTPAQAWVHPGIDTPLALSLSRCWLSLHCFSSIVSAAQWTLPHSLLRWSFSFSSKSLRCLQCPLRFTSHNFQSK